MKQGHDQNECKIDEQPKEKQPEAKKETPKPQYVVVKKEVPKLNEAGPSNVQPKMDTMTEMQLRREAIREVVRFTGIWSCAIT